jgi:coatomer subunit alpha
MHMVRHSRLCGRAIVAYLQSKGFPEVALHFVREPRTRFRLALACGNIPAAMESAFALEQQAENAKLEGATSNTPDVWGELGSEALRQGNHQVVEMSYQRNKDFDRLSFLYLITGDTEKLRKMLKISSMRGDIMGRYHNALLLGDAAERVKVLEESGNLSLAYVCAQIHGLKDDADRIKITVETNGGSIDGLMDKIDPKDAMRLLQPPTPIVRSDNWPTLEVPKTTLEDLSAAEVHAGADGENDYYGEAAAAASAAAATSATADVGMSDWDVEDDVGGGTGAAAAAADDLDFGDDGDLGDWGDDLDGLGEELGASVRKDEMADLSEVGEDVGDFRMPVSGRPPAACWVANSSHSADHMAAGAVSSALQLLNRQIAASDFSVLQSNMIASYLGSTTLVPGIPGSGSMVMPLLRNDGAGHPGSESLPRTPLKLKDLVAGIRNGYRHFQGGKFNDSRAAFITVLTQIPLVVTESKAESNEVKEMLAICREYITAIRIKGAMTDAANDPVRSTELSAYFTHCNLLPAHMLLALRSAMGTAFKHKNFIVAAGFARRLLELPDMSSERNAELRLKATKVLQKSEQMARNEHQLNYDDSKTFVIDCKDFKPIYAGEPRVESSYCGSAYSDQSMANKLCLTNTFTAVGIKTIGLVTGG